MATQQLSIATIEQVLVSGDLARLTVEQRVEYHNLVCKSLGLNPLTRPFNFLVLNGKTVLYATRDCTDQLRKINGVSILSLDSKMIGDLIVVTVSAKDRDGRTDFATGVVNAKQLAGNDQANAMMKSETKAKRRVTLSLCGLGMLDESEFEPEEEVRTGAVQREPGAAALPASSKPPVATPPEGKTLYLQIQKHFTLIKGNTYFLAEHGKKIGATYESMLKVWKMPPARTHELLALCDQLKVRYCELDENGQQVLEVEPQVPLD